MGTIVLLDLVGGIALGPAQVLSSILRSFGFDLDRLLLPMFLSDGQGDRMTPWFAAVHESLVGTKPTWQAWSPMSGAGGNSEIRFRILAQTPSGKSPIRSEAAVLPVKSLR
jgi:hypothetical protein